MSSGSRTILLFRSSPLSAVNGLIRRIREDRPNGPLRWVVVTQPSAEPALREQFAGHDVRFLRYDAPKFTFGEMRQTLLDPLRDESIHTIGVPINNDEGKGYGPIIRFISHVPHNELLIYSPTAGLRRTTPARFFLRRMWNWMEGGKDLASTLGFLLLLPFALAALAVRETSLLVYFYRHPSALITLMLPPVRRTQSKVHYEYHGSRRSQRERMTADPPGSIQEIFIPSEANRQTRTCLVENRVLEMNAAEYFKYRLAAIFSIVEPHLSPAIRVCEFGCGQGPNLFFFKWKYPAARYAGYDFDEEGIELARFLNHRFGLDVQFNVLNMVHPSSEPECDLIFTYCSMEQVKYDTERVLAYFCRLRPKRVIHIEPVYEFYSRVGLGRDFFCRRYIRRADYQDRLYTTLKRMESQRVLQVMEARRLGFSGNPLNESSLMIWRPAGG